MRERDGGDLDETTNFNGHQEVMRFIHPVAPDETRRHLGSSNVFQAGLDFGVS